MPAPAGLARAPASTPPRESRPEYAGRARGEVRPQEEDLHADIAGAFAGGISGGRRVWLVVLGLIGIAVGIYFFMHPVTGVLALLWVVGVYLVALGVFRIIAGFLQPPRAQAA